MSPSSTHLDSRLEQTARVSPPPFSSRDRLHSSGGGVRPGRRAGAGVLPVSAGELLLLRVLLCSCRASAASTGWVLKEPHTQGVGPAQPSPSGCVLKPTTLTADTDRLLGCPHIPRAPAPAEARAASSPLARRSWRASQGSGACPSGSCTAGGGCRSPAPRRSTWWALPANLTSGIHPLACPPPDPAAWCASASAPRSAALRLAHTPAQVHGKPIPVPKVSPQDPLYEETVTELHQKCVDAIQGLYNRWAALCVRLQGPVVLACQRDALVGG